MNRTLVYGLIGLVASATPMYAEPKFGSDSFFNQKTEKASPPPSPTVTKLKRKHTQKAAPAPETPNAVEAKANDLADATNLYVALFTTSNRLFWTGQVTGKIALHGTTRSRMEFAAECTGGDAPCSKFMLRETKPSETSPGYYSFRVGDRLVIWPHTLLFSTTPMSFAEKPVVERF
jgi:hypothetical protein